MLNGYLKKSLIVGILAMASGFSQAERVTLSSNFPWYGEFDKTENPNHNWWCGHAALKMVTAFKTKKVPTLKQLDTYFRQNSPDGYALNRCAYPGGNASWCASLYDIWQAGKINLGMPNTNRLTVSKVVKGLPNYTGFLDGVKNAIKNQKSPVVTVGAYQPNWQIGHTWVIIGYNDNNNPKAPGDAYLFLRDDSQQYPTNPEMDDWITVKDFMKMMDAKDSQGNPYHANSYYEYIVF